MYNKSTILSLVYIYNKDIYIFYLRFNKLFLILTIKELILRILLSINSEYTTVVKLNIIEIGKKYSLENKIVTIANIMNIRLVIVINIFSFVHL